MIEGLGTIAPECRPGAVTVVGTRRNAAAKAPGRGDGETTLSRLPLAGFRLVRRYGKSHQASLPPTSAGEWNVARFDIEGMVCRRTRRPAPRQQRYRGFRIDLAGKLAKGGFLELGWAVMWRGKDMAAPTPPGPLSAKRKNDKVTFHFSPAKDNVMVGHYELLHHDGGKWRPVAVATKDQLELPAATCPPGWYTVQAVDVSGNASGHARGARLTGKE